MFFLFAYIKRLHTYFDKIFFKLLKEGRKSFLFANFMFQVILNRFTSPKLENLCMCIGKSKIDLLWTLFFKKKRLRRFQILKAIS